jgi:hypothetical protein
MDFSNAKAALDRVVIPEDTFGLKQRCPIEAEWQPKTSGFRVSFRRLIECWNWPADPSFAGPHSPIRRPCCTSVIVMFFAPITIAMRPLNASIESSYTA